jgi:membrane-bound ClpP family serine protease
MDVNNRWSRVVMVMVYFSGALLLIALGSTILYTGYDGYQYYLSRFGQLLFIPSEELFSGIGGFIALLGVVVLITGLIELFFCPTCPFTLNKRWQSPTVRSESRSGDAGS